MSELVDLADYRRAVFEQYAAVRSSDDPHEGWNHWRRGRDELFRSHSQTPFDRPEPDHLTPFFDYDPAFRVIAEVEEHKEIEIDIAHSASGETRFQPFGMVNATLPTGRVDLAVYWLSGYGGGIFLPLRDGTAGFETYGGGRYLLDTAKGADLGTEYGRLVLDFNFAYHPSCVYSDRWSCPLAPRQNHTRVRIEAGERLG